jgi:hypothetical protein
MKLKSHLEEARKIKETYKIQMEEKQCLEIKIEAHKEEVEKREKILKYYLKQIIDNLNNLEVEFGQEEKILEK